MSTAKDPVGEMIARVRRLEMVARKNAAGLRPGDYQSAVRGRGLVFHETRKYVPGEPARRIDWNITARLADPHVRVHLEERQRDIFVALDVSPSLHVGFGRRTKLEYAVELAATLAVSVIDAGDRLGHVIFADRELAGSRAEGGRVQLFRVLRSILDHVEPWERPVAESDPRAALHAVSRHRPGPGGGFAIFLISDFVDHDLPEDLKYIRARHEVTLLHVYDPFEFESGPVIFPAHSPEGSADPRAPMPLASRETGDLESMQRFLRDRCGEVGMDFESFDTRLPVAAGLERLFHVKRNRRSGRRRRRG